MSKACTSFGCILLALAAPLLQGMAPAALAQDPQLQRFREEVRSLPNPSRTGPPSSAPPAPGTPSETRPRSPERYDSDPWDEDDDGGLFESAFYLALIAVAAPYWCPRHFLEGEYGLDGLFQRYPYDEVPGYITEDFGGDHCLRYWAGRIAGEYAYDLDDLHRGGGSLLLSTATRFCLDASGNNFREELLPGETDELWTGDVNVVYRFAQHPLVEFRSGIGMNWLADQEKADFGFNFTYSLDVYPKKPWIVSAEIDWGWLGDTSLFHGRLTGGVLLDRFELFTGLDYFDVGHAAFAGPLAGIRVWF